MALVSIEQKFIPGSVCTLFNASDTTKLPEEFPLGLALAKNTKKSKPLIGHLQNDNKHMIGGITCFMTIPSGLVIWA